MRKPDDRSFYRPIPGHPAQHRMNLSVMASASILILSILIRWRSRYTGCNLDDPHHTSREAPT